MATQTKALPTLLLLLLLLPATPLPATEPAPTLTGVHYVYLIRHGLYDRDDAADDRTGNGLNALGHEQARLMGERLAGLPVKINSLVSSNYTRARETAADMAAVLETAVIEDSLLHECLPKTERADLMKDATPGEIADCESNLASAWQKYMRPTPEYDSHDVLVCHGNVIRWFVAKAIGAGTERWSTMDVGNGSLTVLAVRSDGSTRLVMYSDVGHLPLEKQSWAGRGAGWGKQAPR
jgi:serine/threonine-protein phosphatase PGAM5